MGADGSGAVDHLWIVGAGRLGLALALALRRANAVDRLTVAGRSPNSPSHPLFHPDAPDHYRPDLTLPEPPPSGIVIAVPDTAIGTVAAALARLPLPSGLPILHTSGALDTEPLAPVAARGAAVGTLHPLAAVADPVEGAERLVGAWWGLDEGSPAAAFASRLIRSLEGRELRIPSGARAGYHAGAVFAANYVVTLLGVAERVLARAGFDPVDARAALTALTRGAVADVAQRGAGAALTGPVARGDAGTVERHLAVLSGSDRALYSALAREALAQRRTHGELEPAAVEAIERVLGGGE